MPETSFHTTYSDRQYLLSQAKNSSESGLRKRGCHRFGFNHAAAWQVPQENQSECVVVT